MIFMVTTILKRDGRRTQFDSLKIAKAIFKAAKSVGGNDTDTAIELAQQVVDYIENEENIAEPSVERIMT